MFRTLVLSGGALRGFALLGALQALYDRNYVSHIEKYIGTSIGAIIAYLLCIGYTPVEILVYLCKERCIEQMSNMDVISGLSGKGFLPFTNIRSILETMTFQKMDAIPTLLDLFTRTQKQFICTTYNYTLSQLEFLDYHSHPSLSCLDALQMSSSLPLLFEPFLYKDHLYVDGALISNFPLFYIETGDEPILGIRFRKTTPSFSESISLLNLCYHLLHIPTNYIEQLLNDPLLSRCTIFDIDLSDCDHSLNFKLNNSHRLDMFSKGYETIVNDAFFSSTT